MANVKVTIIPDKPQSSKQKYRLTQNGRDIVAKLVREAEADEPGK